MQDILTHLKQRLGQTASVQKTQDQIQTLWIDKQQVLPVLKTLKSEIENPFRMLYDLTAIDESRRSHANHTTGDLSLVYQLYSFERNQYLRLKTALDFASPNLSSVTSLWPAANWYEREVYDMFGVEFENHPNLTRILMPDFWQGHPLRKEHPARATEIGPFQASDYWYQQQQESLRFDPSQEVQEEQADEDSDIIYLNLGPQHPGTHGVLRVILKLSGEEIQDTAVEIGYHHRGAEKMAERQTWHSFIPYTDRIDYLGGVLNNLPYVLAVEKLAGIEVPERAQVIRVMMCELFRIASHLVWYGTFAQDVGALSPVFYMFSDRERLFGIVEAICGGRMHPSWFRIGGVAHDLPQGWRGLIEDFVKRMPSRLAEYDRLVMKNKIFQARTKGIGSYTQAEAIEWGVTGPGLRATGLDWDLRRVQPYSGYDQFDFEIPVAHKGDCYDRAVVRIEEMRQSLRIIQQCLDKMPQGPYKSDHPLTTPPRKEKTMHDIETLIHHFLSVTWGPVVPAGEAFVAVEASKGSNGYYLISDGSASSYRTRIRAPSFAHMQMLPTTLPSADDSRSAGDPGQSRLCFGRHRSLEGASMLTAARQNSPDTDHRTSA